jgi:hypothetical protein
MTFSKVLKAFLLSLCLHSLTFAGEFGYKIDDYDRQKWTSESEYLDYFQDFLKDEQRFSKYIGLKYSYLDDERSRQKFNLGISFFGGTLAGAFVWLPLGAGLDAGFTMSLSCGLLCASWVQIFSEDRKISIREMLERTLKDELKDAQLLKHRRRYPLKECNNIVLKFLDKVIQENHS